MRGEKYPARGTESRERRKRASWDAIETKWKSESCSVVSSSLQSHGLYSTWTSPGQNTGVGSRSLLQGIIPAWGLNPGLLHFRQILYCWATREAHSHHTTFIIFRLPKKKGEYGLGISRKNLAIINHKEYSFLYDRHIPVLKDVIS